MQSLTAVMVCSPAKDGQEELEPSQSSHPSMKTSDSETKGDEIYFALVTPLVKAIKGALKWVEPVESSAKQKEVL